MKKTSELEEKLLKAIGLISFHPLHVERVWLLFPRTTRWMNRAKRWVVLALGGEWERDTEGRWIYSKAIPRGTGRTVTFKRFHEDTP